MPIFLDDDAKAWLNSDATDGRVATNFGENISAAYDHAKANMGGASRQMLILD